jgi:hypothetical protein
MLVQLQSIRYNQFLNLPYMNAYSIFFSSANLLYELIKLLDEYAQLSICCHWLFLELRLVAYTSCCNVSHAADTSMHLTKHAVTGHNHCTHYIRAVCGLVSMI